MAARTRSEARPDAGSATLAAYEALAPYYDRFTHDYEHGPWLAAIEAWARSHGLRGRRLLDVACGTGKSFEPMLSRGYAVTACDLSPGMVAAARARVGPDVDVVVADMRSLPWRRRFDLVTCINDAINYLLTDDDLERALRSIGDALAPGGMAVFDTNSLHTYRTSFAARFERTRAGCSFRWRGGATEDFAAGGLATATLSVDPGERARHTRHTQRHWPVEALRSACLAAGFERVLFRGQLLGGRLVSSPDEDRHTKVVCLAIKPSHDRARRSQLQPSRWGRGRRPHRRRGGEAPIASR